MLALKLDGTTYPLRWQRDVMDRRSVRMIDPETGETNACLSWHRYTGEIKFVSVAQNMQRRGIATALLTLARQRDPRIHHSAIRSDSGDAWARSFREPIPDRFVFTKSQRIV